MIPGEYVLRSGAVVINAGRESIDVVVLNTGDRPVQVGSHYHFAEANPALDFDRQAAYGRRLDIPAGTAARFEPGDRKTVRLIELAGSREVYGLSNAVNGSLGPGGKTQAGQEGERSELRIDQEAVRGPLRPDDGGRHPPRRHRALPRN